MSSISYGFLSLLIGILFILCISYLVYQFIDEDLAEIGTALCIIAWVLLFVFLYATDAVKKPIIDVTYDKEYDIVSYKYIEDEYGNNFVVTYIDDNKGEIAEDTYCYKDSGFSTLYITDTVEKAELWDITVYKKGWFADYYTAYKVFLMPEEEFKDTVLSDYQFGGDKDE